MEFIKHFNNLSKSDTPIAGGKGASLGEMTAAGIPVPPGFVVLAGSFDAFITANGLATKIDTKLARVDTQNIGLLDEISEKIRKMILDSKMPEDIENDIEIHFKSLDAELVAVRSSATAEDGASASWAGELESYLNTTQDTLLENVQRCWASLFTPRAIIYRIEKKMSADAVSVAVVVQKMVQSDVSGITFTVHPVTKDANQMVIEAGWGLGEAIVGGQVTPDNYIINKDDMSIADSYISDQEMMIVRSPEGTKEQDVPADKVSMQKLEGSKIIELAKICAGIEKHYGFPCDIEWAMEKDKLYIVQSRPITTL